MMRKSMQQVITEENRYERHSPPDSERDGGKKGLPAVLLERILSRKKPCTPRLAAIAAHSPRGTQSTPQLELGFDPSALSPRTSRSNSQLDLSAPNTHSSHILPPRTSLSSSPHQQPHTASNPSSDPQLDPTRASTTTLPPRTFKSTPQLDLDTDKLSPSQPRPSFLSPRSTLSPIPRSSSLTPGASQSTQSSPQIDLDLEQLERPRPGFLSPRSHPSLDLTSLHPTARGAYSGAGVGAWDQAPLRGPSLSGSLQRSAAPAPPGAPSTLKFPLPPESPRADASSPCSSPRVSRLRQQTKQSRTSQRCGPADPSSIDAAAESVYQLLVRDPSPSPLSRTSSAEKAPLPLSPHAHSSSGSPKPSAEYAHLPHSPHVHSSSGSPKPSADLGPLSRASSAEQHHSSVSILLPRQASEDRSEEHAELTKHGQPFSSFSHDSTSPNLSTHHHHHHQQQQQHHHHQKGTTCTSPPQPPWSTSPSSATAPNVPCTQPLLSVFAAPPPQSPTTPTPNHISPTPPSTQPAPTTNTHPPTMLRRANSRSLEAAPAAPSSRHTSLSGSALAPTPRSVASQGLVASSFPASTPRAHAAEGTGAASSGSGGGGAHSMHSMHSTHSVSSSTHGTSAHAQGLSPHASNSATTKSGVGSTPNTCVAASSSVHAANGRPLVHSLNGSFNSSTTNTTTNNTNSDKNRAPGALPAIQGSFSRWLPPKPRLPYMPSLNLGALGARKKHEEGAEEEGSSGAGTQKVGTPHVPSLNLGALSARKHEEGTLSSSHRDPNNLSRTSGTFG